MRGGRRAAEGPGGTEVATAANINSTRRSEKVKVLGETLPKVQRLQDPRTFQHTFTYKHKHKSRGLTSRRIHCGVEVTK